MSRTKRILPLIVLVLVVLGMSACASQPHGPEEVYYLVSNNIKLPYWRAVSEGFIDAAKQMGVRAEVVGPDRYDPAAEAAELRRITAKKPAGILVSAADVPTIAPAIDEAVNQGIPVITIDSDAPGSKRLFFVGTDNNSVGIIGGQFLVKSLNGKGNVVFYTIPNQPNLQQRMGGYRDILSRYPGIKIVQEIDIKGDAAVAFDETKALLDKKVPVDAFVCLEAIACKEVAEVLSREKITGKVILAMDTDEDTLEWIRKGMIQATIAQKPYTMGYVGLRLLAEQYLYKLPSLTADFARNIKSPIPAAVDTGIALIDKNNIDQFASK